MDDFEANEQAREEFVEIYRHILESVRDLDESALSLRSKGVIIKQMEAVLMRLTETKIEVQQKVGDLMGGKVVEMEWLKQFDAAVAKGREEGREDQLVMQICKKLKKGKDVHQIADDLEEDEIRIQVICDVAAAFAPEYDSKKVIEVLGVKEKANETENAS